MSKQECQDVHASLSRHSVPVTAVKHAMSSHKKEEEWTREGLWTWRTFRQHIVALIVHSAIELQ